ncbi:MAG: DUF4097 family beta strand repeat-containing protein [Caldiserica bacterium]|nr:DUF4097 family beta strand repeat-containing protein [Caldisericota bacterium]MDH7561933.1 DUF4097 family beta strand repeat-containing protein [Caldisericota bacterium]
MNQDFKDFQEVPQSPPKPPDERKSGRRPDYVLPLILIALGVIFLISEFGVSINWSIIWPIFLILIGVGMIISRRVSGLWVGLVIFFLILAALFTFVLAPAFSLRLGETVSYADGPPDPSLFQGAKRINFNYSAPLGKIEIKPNSLLPRDTFQLQTTTNIQDLPRPSISRAGDAVSIECSFPTQGVWFAFPWLPNLQSARLERSFSLNSSLPLNLKLSMTSGSGDLNTEGIPIEEARIKFTSGALLWDAGKISSSLSPQISFDFTSGTANVLNLGSTNFSSLDINFTSGQGTFDLSGFGGGSHSVSVKLTSGSVDLIMPRTAGYRIQVEKTTGSVNLDGRALQSGDLLENDAFSTAPSKLDISLRLTTGTINIRFTD